MSRNEPTVSVIIPAKEAAETLPRALTSIDAQTYPNVIEVIVATADEPTRLAAGQALVVDNPIGSTPAALNLALERARGEVIVRCDAHSVLPPDYIEHAVQTLSETGAANVGGMQVPVGETQWQQAIAAAMTSPLGAGDARYRLGGEPGSVETVYLGVFRRSAIESIGGFDETFLRTQDYELNHRLIAAGEVVWFDPDLQVEYRPRSSLAELGQQYFDYGRAKRQFSRRHPGSLRWRQLAPPGIVLGLALSLALSIWLPILLLAPLGYLVALISVEFVREAADPIRVAAALATMHLGWGIGFLIG